MNKTLVGLVLVALVIGLGGGYGLGYMIYQPQVTNVQNSLDELTARLDDLNSTILGNQQDLDDRLVTVNSSATSLQSQLTSVESEIIQLNSTLNTVGSSVTFIQNQLISLQNQLSSLNTRLTNLNATVNQIENRTWHVLWSSSGSSNATSGYFQLKGKTFHIGWSYNALYTNCWIEISLRFQNGTIYWIDGSSGVYGAFDAEGPTEQAGLYYLVIRVSSNVDWGVVVEDFY